MDEHSSLIEALRENTEQVRRLNELLAPELKRSAVLRESRDRQAETRAGIRRDLARIRAEDARISLLSGGSGETVSPPECL